MTEYVELWLQLIFVLLVRTPSDRPTLCISIEVRINADDLGLVHSSWSYFIVCNKIRKGEKGDIYTVVSYVRVIDENADTRSLKI